MMLWYNGILWRIVSPSIGVRLPVASPLVQLIAGVSEPALSKLTYMGAGSETAWKWYHQEKQIRLLMSPPHGAVALIGRAPDLHSGG